MKNRSFFWPFVMIATGFLWLLITLGRLPSENLWALTQIWPYLLMALGLGLIVRSFWRQAGILISALIVLGATLSVLFAAQVGWNKPVDWSFDTINIGSEVGGGIPGSKVIVSEKREVGAFSTVDLSYPAEVVIRQGEVDSVTVKADDNLTPQLSTKVINGHLIIENNTPVWNKRVYPSQVVSITIVVKNLRSVEFPSAGEVRIEGIRSEDLDLSVPGAGSLSLTEVQLGSLEMHLSGAGSITAQGTAQKLNLDISGAGSFTGRDLSVGSADVLISGLGSATLWVTEKLDAQISGMGSVNYYGSPLVSKSISGVGNVNSLGAR